MLSHPTTVYPSTCQVAFVLPDQISLRTERQKKRENRVDSSSGPRRRNDGEGIRTRRLTPKSGKSAQTQAKCTAKLSEQQSLLSKNFQLYMLYNVCYDRAGEVLADVLRDRPLELSTRW